MTSLEIDAKERTAEQTPPVFNKHIRRKNLSLSQSLIRRQRFFSYLIIECLSCQVKGTRYFIDDYSSINLIFS